LVAKKTGGSGSAFLPLFLPFERDQAFLLLDRKKKNEIVESSSSIESSHRATTDLLDSYS